MRDANFLVSDQMADFRRQLTEILNLPMADLESFRRIGSLKLVEEQSALVKMAAQTGARDAAEILGLVSATNIRKNCPTRKSTISCEPSNAGSGGLKENDHWPV